MWIDTHCHLDAAEFSGLALAIVDQASQVGVRGIVIPAVSVQNFAAVEQLAEQRQHCFFALGIHPVYIAEAKDADLLWLRERIGRLLEDSCGDHAVGRQLVAIGEIGLDFFVPALTTPAMREKQEYFYVEQLKIARDFKLPVLLHVRRSVDVILKYLRRIPVTGGIAHAFNGSQQQAQEFLKLGFKLGFGGAMTFTRALQIRRLAQELPEHAFVLETDAPDISPAWLHPEKNSPVELPRIGAVLAGLRGVDVALIAQQSSANAQAVLPRMLAMSGNA